MPYLFFWIAIILAMLDWLAVAKGWKRLEYFAKPGVIVALLAFVGINGGFGPLAEPGQTMLWMAAGLVFALFGDIFLMLPKRQFTLGLAAFFICHVFYIIGLSPVPPIKVPHLYVAGAIALLVLFTWQQVYRRIAQGMMIHRHTSSRLPVFFYTLIISITMIAALFTLLRGSWKPFHALPVVAGAASFLLSDTILAWDKFVAPISNSRLKNILLYHLAQTMLTLGSALHFLGGK